jgi:hypothetical protein
MSASRQDSVGWSNLLMAGQSKNTDSEFCKTNPISAHERCPAYLDGRRGILQRGHPRRTGHRSEVSFDFWRISPTLGGSARPGLGYDSRGETANSQSSNAPSDDRVLRSVTIVENRSPPLGHRVAAERSAHVSSVGTGQGEASVSEGNPGRWTKCGRQGLGQ